MNFSKKYTLVLVDAKWNNHKELAAKFAKIAKDCTDENFDFQELDVDEDQELAYALGIKNVPAICYFFEGRFDKMVIGNNQDIKQQMQWLAKDCDDGWDL
jgi:thioredoxin-like negative regulator of GroEL